MPIEITYFVHGTTTDNEAGISSGWNNVDLSKLGIQQSINLKGQIKDKKFDAVFCSDLKRAVESTKLMFDNTTNLHLVGDSLGQSGLKIIQDKRLRECNYGKYNGKPSKIVEPLCEKYINEKFPEGESYQDVEGRVSDFLEDLKKDYYGKNIAIVSHKAPQLALDVLVKGKTWKVAFSEDWRRTKSWQPGWEYKIN